MNVEVSLDRMVGAVERAQTHWETQRRQPARLSHRLSTIALERDCGTPASEVAHALGQRLGWVVYDHELVEKIAQEMGLRTRLVESVDEKHASWLQEAVREVMQAVSAAPSVSEGEYVRYLLETLFGLAAHGECIIVGRGAAQILPPSSTLRIKLVAPLETRLAAVQQEMTLSPREAEKYLRDTDHQRELFIRENFRRDPHHVEHYDLALNTSRWNTGQCVELISEALRKLG